MFRKKQRDQKERRMHLRRILERGELRSDVSGRALGGSLFTSTVAVCSSRAGRPAPQPSARGSGYWDATPAVWGCSVATIRGVQEPYGGGAPWRKRGKKHGKIRQKVRLRSRVQGCDLTCHLLALASSRRGVHADFKNGRFLSNSTGFICNSSDCSDQLDIMPEWDIIHWETDAACLTCVSMLGWSWRGCVDWFCWTTGTPFSILTG